MASVNKVILVGNLGRDPEMRTFPSGDQVANVRIATTDRWRDKNTGENRESTEWHSVVFNGRLAEIVGQYLRKGSQVYVEGSLRTRKWTDQSGQERYTTEIRADAMQMLGGRQGGGADEGWGGGTGAAAPMQSTPRRAAAPARPAAAPANDWGQPDDGVPYAPPVPARAPQASAPMPAASPSAGFGPEDDDIPF